MVNINQIEREFLYGRISGVTSQTTISQMRRQFYIEYIGGASSTTGMKELERLFLEKVVANNAGTPTAYPTWKEAVAALGVTPAKYENENKILLYQNLP